MKPSLRLVFWIVALLAIVVFSAAVASADCGLFNRAHTSTQIAAVEPAGPTVLQPVAPGPAAERPYLLPWNCPNGKCRPHDQVDVNVVVPDRKTDAPLFIAPVVEPAPPPRFPYGVLIAVLIPVILVSSAVAFVVRVSASRT